MVQRIKKLAVEGEKKNLNKWTQNNRRKQPRELILKQKAESLAKLLWFLYIGLISASQPKCLYLSCDNIYCQFITYVKDKTG